MHKKTVFPFRIEKKICRFFILLVTVGFLSGVPSIHAEEYVSDAEIVKIRSYQNSATHFVWTSQGNISECQEADPGNPVLFFSEQATGGKSLLAVFLTAIAANRKVDIRVNGCEIVEVFFK